MLQTWWTLVTNFPICNPWCWNIYPQNWVIYGDFGQGQMLVNIPAPWFAYGFGKVNSLQLCSGNHTVEDCRSATPAESLPVRLVSPGLVIESFWGPYNLMLSRCVYRCLPTFTPHFVQFMIVSHAKFAESPSCQSHPPIFNTRIPAGGAGYSDLMILASKERPVQNFPWKVRLFVGNIICWWFVVCSAVYI